jgi:hypothetical protein
LSTRKDDQSLKGGGEQEIQIVDLRLMVYNLLFRLLSLAQCDEAALVTAAYHGEE